MQGSFERFDPEALVRHRIGEAPRTGLAGLQPVPVERGRSIRFNRSVLSVLAGAGLAVMALGAFRSPELDSAWPGVSIGDLTRDTGELPISKVLDVH